MDRKEAQRKLQEVLPHTFDSLFGAKIIVDEEGIVLYASPFHYEYLGYTSEDQMIGKYVEDVIPGTRMQVILKTEQPEFGYVFNFVNKDSNSVTPVITNRAPIYDSNHKLIGALAECIFPQGIGDVLQLAEEVGKIKDRQNSEAVVKSEHISDYIVGDSTAIQNLRSIIVQCAAFPLPVLITGETGTGKEVFANAIHKFSNRSDKNYVKINCAAIPSELLESELFGYEPGTFSGALPGGKIGKFEYAKDGTVLLDEIGDMPFALQSKLLRAIQEKEFEKVGGLKPKPFNARIICTTNRDMSSLIAEDKFRQDLYYRINAIEINIPPLRTRKEDIMPLCRYFIDVINRQHGLSIAGVENAAIDLLSQYDWPGNVRELRHVVERACFMVGAGILKKDNFLDVEEKVRQHNFDREISHGRDMDFDSLSEARNYAEITEIKKALSKANGNKSLAAKILKIDRTILYDKIKKYNIE